MDYVLLKERTPDSLSSWSTGVISLTRRHATRRLLSAAAGAALPAIPSGTPLLTAPAETPLRGGTLSWVSFPEPQAIIAINTTSGTGQTIGIYGEMRVSAVGEVDGDMIQVVFTDRVSGRRIISARAASRKERREWHALVLKTSATLPLR